MVGALHLQDRRLRQDIFQNARGEIFWIAGKEQTPIGLELGTFWSPKVAEGLNSTRAQTIPHQTT